MDSLKRLFISDTSNIITQLFRYIIVGGISFLVDYGLLYTLTEFLSVYYLVSATISFIAGLVVNYYLSTRWIFRHSKIQNRLAEFTVYSLIGVIGLLLNNVILFSLTDLLGFHYLISKLISAVLVMGWNFVGRRFILFKD